MRDSWTNLVGPWMQLPLLLHRARLLVANIFRGRVQPIRCGISSEAQNWKLASFDQSSFLSLCVIDIGPVTWSSGQQIERPADVETEDALVWSGCKDSWRKMRGFIKLHLYKRRVFTSAWSSNKGCQLIWNLWNLLSLGRGGVSTSLYYISLYLGLEIYI